MFVFRRGRSGGRYTFISIILILTVLYIYRYTMPQKDIRYPGYIHYSGSTYEYSEALRSSPVFFKKLRGQCDEGYIVLARRGKASWEALKELYIYEGFLIYRKYVIKNEYSG